MSALKAYIFLVGGLFLALGVWGIIFLIVKNATPEKQAILGPIFLGPMYPYIKKRGFAFSKREVIGWGAVLLMMLSAPWISYLLEGEKALTGR